MDLFELLYAGAIIDLGKNWVLVEVVMWKVGLARET